MKKLLFYTVFLFAIAVVSYSQDDITRHYYSCILDTNNTSPTHIEIESSGLNNYREDTANIFYPQVYKYSCIPCISICSMHSTQVFEREGDTIFAVRQPYHTDTVIALDGIVFVGRYLHVDSLAREGEVGLLHHYDVDSMLYFQIMDNNDSVIYQIRYDTINDSIKSTYLGDNPMALKYSNPMSAYQVTFDSIVYLQGDFYVVATYGNWLGRYGINIVPLQLSMAGMFCDTNEYKYPFPEVQFKGDTSWVSIKDQYHLLVKDMSDMSDITVYEYTNLISMIDIYPRLNTTGYISGSSNIENVDNKEISVDIFPNPAKEEVNINCGYKIKSLQVFDEQGKRLFEKEINTYNYQINLENYPAGTYLIRVQTNSGQATKKVIKE
ncbi:MAG: T9SS type A sorting domain-containing protein [Bacteroidales bacterium]|nr:T9SS type A sorting domain-containing protein [Bacteroidales bacterium]